MSDDTLERLVQAAKAFKNDVTQLPGLRNALAAHDADEGASATPEPVTEGTNAGGATDVTVTEAPEGTSVTP